MDHEFITLCFKKYRNLWDKDIDGHIRHIYTYACPHDAHENALSLLFSCHCLGFVLTPISSAAYTSSHRHTVGGLQMYSNQSTPEQNIAKYADEPSPGVFDDHVKYIPVCIYFNTCIWPSVQRPLHIHTYMYIARAAYVDPRSS